MGAKKNPNCLTGKNLSVDRKSKSKGEEVPLKQENETIPSSLEAFPSEKPVGTCIVESILLNISYTVMSSFLGDLSLGEGKEGCSGGPML